MKGYVHSVAVLAAMLMVAPLDAQAQRGQMGRRGPGFEMRGQGVENIMRLRDRLELSESQIEQLDQIRREAVQRRTAHQAEMEELRSQARAGQIEPEALREVVQARQEAAQAVRDQQQERVDAILTDAQKEELDTLRGQARAFQRGRQSARRGGGRGGAWRGGRPGWSGFGPGMRPRVRFDRRPGVGWRFRPGGDAGPAA
jgi:Spy/CpxP family protein refolding chaperone